LVPFSHVAKDNMEIKCQELKAVHADLADSWAKTHSSQSKGSYSLEETDLLKAKLLETEQTLDEALGRCEGQIRTIQDLNRQIQENQSQQAQFASMRDELQELHFIADKASKSEMMLTKYKKKVESLLEFKNRVRELEGLAHTKDDRIAELEEELRKEDMLKKLMNSYKDQVASLETRNSALSVDNSGLLAQLELAQSDIKRLEADRIRDQEHLQSLSEKLQDSESNQLNGIICLKFC
jgi:protein HOOK3